MNLRSKPLPAALAALVVATASPAAAAQKAELHVEAATHTMPGMGGLGALGRLTGNMAGGTAAYGQARHPGMPGRYLDIALDNTRKPGSPATQAIPKDLRLGKALDLLPPEQRVATPAGVSDGGIPGLAQDSNYEVRFYWGCGEEARKGQPRKFTVTVRDGRQSMSGSAPQPRAVPKLGVESDPRYALWPNQSSRKTVPGKASLVGAHSVTGDGLSRPIDFRIDPAQDFMPELELRSGGEAAQGISLDWNPVDGARAYFIHAMGMDGDVVVMWSSSEDGYAGPELMSYLPGNTISQWLGKGTLLSPGTRRCAIPKEIFAAHPMVQMIAYGGTRTIEGDEWRVHLRNKSTAMLMGAGMGAGMSAEPVEDSARESAKDSARDAAKGLLRGLLRR